MKNYFSIIKNNNESSSSNNKDDSFYSFQSYPRNYKFINRKRNGIYIGNNIFHRINKIQKNQNKTNKKLDLLLSLIKSKLLGEYDYNISHYDFCIHKTKKYYNLNEIKTKEENDLNIKDDFSFMGAIKNEPYNPSKNLYKKLQKIYDNKNNNINIENNGNLSQIINDFLNENKNERNKNEENGNNNIINENNNYSVGNNNNNCIDRNIKNINNENFDIKKEIIKNNIIKSTNDKLIDDFNNNINSLLNNLNKSFKKDIDLNKYKFESNKNNININNNKNGLNEEKENIININKIEISDLVGDKNNNIIENDNFQNININEEKNNISNNINNILKNEEEKELEKRLDNFQSDNISIKSSPPTSSDKKSNQSSSRKIRGFNFKNNIKMKKYNAIKFNSISSSNNNQKK